MFLRIHLDALKQRVDGSFNGFLSHRSALINGDGQDANAGYRKCLAEAGVHQRSSLVPVGQTTPEHPMWLARLIVTAAADMIELEFRWMA